MVFSWKPSCIWVLLLLSFVQIYCPYLVNSQLHNYPIANLSTSWTNSLSTSHSMNFSDGSRVSAILVRGTDEPLFACGFFCNGNCDAYLFAIFILQTFTNDTESPRVVWSANRNNPVGINAKLQLTSEGDLVLRDADGTLVWSTKTAGKSVAGLNLAETGNLFLFDSNNAIVWQSFDHPTDCLLHGQKLVSGQNLTASVSATNWSTTQGGSYSLFVSKFYMAFQIGYNPPQIYYKIEFDPTGRKEPSYSSVTYLNGNLSIVLHHEANQSSDMTKIFYFPSVPSVQYIKLEHDGHLNIYARNPQYPAWDTLQGYFLNLDECSYPTACQENGICLNGQCSCPGSNNGKSYFKPIDERQLNRGCSETTPLTCEASQYHSFLELKNITYFTFIPDYRDTNIESCKQACLKNCSCKAVIFLAGANSSNGDCFLPPQIFSLENNVERGKNWSAFIKVQNGPSALASSSKKTGWAVVGALFVALFIIISISIFLLWKEKYANEIEENYLDQVPGMPTRFSYEVLKAATENFSRKIGEGGFGQVFEGTLSNGTKVAVKQLEGLGHIKKSFLAEVETIGSIHHINLVRLVGFCAEKFHRLLVYEFMCNGSLDKWIFHKKQELAFGWQHRKKIILDIAKGLAYLHEECRQKIIHLDIKPQNILLDENFNAKVSDFGLSKLIDRDQSRVMTTMRGTPGYLAPEWLSSVITEKVDVYSYGVMILEILCGRKNLERSQPEESMHLLSIFNKKMEEGRLLELVDNYSEDMQLHGAEAVEMMRVAAWCLQSDFARRPSMSVVVMVLEGVMEVEDELDYNFANPQPTRTMVGVGQEEVNFGGAATQLLPSVLSGPR